MINVEIVWLAIIIHIKAQELACKNVTVVVSISRRRKLETNERREKRIGRERGRRRRKED